MGKETKMEVLYTLTTIAQMLSSHMELMAGLIAMLPVVALVSILTVDVRGSLDNLKYNINFLLGR